MLSVQHGKSELVRIQPVDEHDIVVLDNEVSQIENSGMEFILSAFCITC